MYEMRVVVKIMSVLIMYWKNVFFFFAYCFINPDIELGICLCSHRERERDFQIQLRMKYITFNKFKRQDNTCISLQLS